MTQFAGRMLSTTVDIKPGEVQTYRLPTMMPGALMVDSRALPFPPSADAVINGTSRPAGLLLNPVGGGGFGNPGGGGLGDPNGGGGGGGPLGNPGVLVMDLLHGDQVVQSGQVLVPQPTGSTADATWRLRLQLAPGTIDHPTYPFAIDLNFPSVLPILQRRHSAGCVSTDLRQQLEWHQLRICQHQ